ncbi:hypothetical protein [Aestuariivivens sediminis]|uniref:hypothetical protein n=1 Tax=Aestuariivivens sediminis TaxID=2913557 RepID=UPI001F57288C|nr:hypothetical protein [Aestuariivivens sediminis]
MENSTFFMTYLLTFIACAILSVGLIMIMNKGLKKFFENLTQDHDISAFFTKLTNSVILLGGLGAALATGYNTSKDPNWLTLTWDIAEQLEESLFRLFITLMIFTIAFFIIQLILRKKAK